MNPLPFFSIFSNAVGFKDKYLSLKSWQTWCQQMLSQYTEGGDEVPDTDDLDPEGESPAVEVMKYRDPGSYFAGESNDWLINPSE